MAANMDLVLAALRRASEPLSDAELVSITGIRPHQQVNQICRRLAAEGRIVRFKGINRIRNTMPPSDEYGLESRDSVRHPCI